MEEQRKDRNHTASRALSIEEFANFLGCSERLLWRLIREKTLGCARIGKRVVLLPVHISDFLLRHSVDAN